MSGNVFGSLFRIATFGESHGAALGVVIDGVPPGICLDLDAIQRDLDRRRPGQSAISTARRESDEVKVLSGLFEGTTTGAPLCLVVGNDDARSKDYEPLRHVFRPGHADHSWWQKYGIRDHRGGGRSSGRETVARVAAGAVARQILAAEGISIVASVVEIAGIAATSFDKTVIDDNLVRCADAKAAEAMERAIIAAREEGDSVGGIVEVCAEGLPAGWGDPVFDKLDARLAYALMGIGAVKGVEVGAGFAIARMRGSEANDVIATGSARSNHAGGILGGVSSGAPLVLRLAVKPTPSISLDQQTVNDEGESCTINIKGRHDPCIAPRLVPVAEAMTALVLVDAMMRHRALQA